MVCLGSLQGTQKSTLQIKSSTLYTTLLGLSGNTDVVTKY